MNNFSISSLLFLFISVTSTSCSDFRVLNKRSHQADVNKNGFNAFSNRSIILEAENHSEINNAVIASNHAGASGDEFLDFHGQGAYVIWGEDKLSKFNLSRGTYTIEIQYGNGRSRPSVLYINNTRVIEATLSVQGPDKDRGDWSKWKTESYENIVVDEAIKELKLVAENSAGPNLDYIRLIRNDDCNDISCNTDLPTSFDFGSTWKYSTQDPGENWVKEDFNDEVWNEGRGEFGYGDGDEGHETERSPSTYFRKKFNVAADKQAISLEVRHDDGFALWINGQLFEEKYVDKLDHNSYASSQSADNEISNVYLGSSWLKVGENTIAVMVKQHSATSSDLSFDMKLDSEEYEPEVIAEANDSNKVIAIGASSTYNCRKSDGEGINFLSLSLPKGVKNGDLMLLFLHRTDKALYASKSLLADNGLPKLEGSNIVNDSTWTKEISCHMRNNGQECTNNRDHNDLVQHFLYKFYEEGDSKFLQIPYKGAKSSWATLVALRNADRDNPILDAQRRSPDGGSSTTTFPGVETVEDGFLVLSQSFDDHKDMDNFRPPKGFDYLEYVTGDENTLQSMHSDLLSYRTGNKYPFAPLEHPCDSDETGYLYGKSTEEGDHGEEFTTQGDGGDSAKDIMISVSINPILDNE